MTRQDERIDTLLALSLTFEMAGAGEPSRTAAAQAAFLEEQSGASNLQTLSQFALLHEADRQQVAAQLAQYKKLSRDARQRWLSHVLVNINPDHATPHLDLHIHPLQIVEALREETTQIQKLILRQLPARLAEACADALDLSTRQERAGNIPRQPSAFKAAFKADEAASASTPGDSTPDKPHRQKLLKIIHRSFNERFVSSFQLPSPTELELLARPDLTRLFRALGVREMAIACRGEQQAGNIAQIWRRFPPEDMRVFAEQMATFDEIEPRRIALAEEIIEEALEVSPDTVAALDYTGLRLLSFVLRTRDALSVNYTLQKLAPEQAHYLRRMLSRSSSHADDEVIQMLVEEVEGLAANLYRAARRETNR
ncbi:MAG TPA: hypothetical protein VGB73_09845 [Pyrinomonadaceae bacterium]|jgi:hypothetical protein